MALNINGTTGISGVDGSVSAPAVTGTDSNTGITFPAADTIKFSTGGVERMAITNSGISGISGGKILQVVQDTKLDTQTIPSQTFIDVSGLSVTITPSATSSKILVLFSVSVASNSYGMINLVRGSTDIFKGDAGGNRVQCTVAAMTQGAYQVETYSHTFLDSPNTTSATTYKLQGATPHNASYTLHINRSHSDTDYNYEARSCSSITVMEVAA